VGLARRLAAMGYVPRPGGLFCGDDGRAAGRAQGLTLTLNPNEPEVLA